MNALNAKLNEDVALTFKLQDAITPFLRWPIIIISLSCGVLFLSDTGAYIAPNDPLFIGGAIVSCTSMLLTLFILNKAYITAYEYYHLAPTGPLNAEAYAHIAERRTGNLWLASFLGLGVCYIGNAMAVMSPVDSFWSNIVHYPTLAVNLILITLIRDLHKTTKKHPK